MLFSIVSALQCARSGSCVRMVLWPINSSPKRVSTRGGLMLDHQTNAYNHFPQLMTSTREIGTETQWYARIFQLPCTNRSRKKNMPSEEWMPTEDV